MVAEQVEAGWSRDYIAYMRCDAGDAWMPEVESQLGAWLREKRLDVDVTKDADLASDSVNLSVRRANDGNIAELKLALVERTSNNGIWTTELFAHDEPGGQDWVSLSVANDEGRFVDVPRIARYLMQVLPLGDGAIEFVDKPQLFGFDDIDRLVDLLADDRRRGLVFVAGTSDDLPLGAFRDKVNDWARQVYGLAEVIVLDPAATRAFADRVGTRLAAPALTIRTYHPGVKFDDAEDARRHRILGTKRLAQQSDGRIRHLLGDIARNHSASREVPPAVVRTRRRFQRIENRRLLEAPGSVEVAVPDVVAPRALAGAVDAATQLTLVKRILKLERITEVALQDIAKRIAGTLTRDRLNLFEKRVDELQSEVEGLEDSNRDVVAMLEDEQLEHEVTRLDLDDAHARINWLQARLKEKGDYEAGYLETPDEFRPARPANFEELIERIGELQGVEFTGDLSETLRLSAIDTNDSALRIAWDGVLALADYVKARAAGDCDGSLDHYIHHTPTGYQTFPPKKFAESESGETMRRWGNQRAFPVPTDVSASGEVLMKAHFKLAKIGRATPRMHVYDAHPGKPVVYIGYIGTHLTNTKSRSM